MTAFYLETLIPLMMTQKFSSFGNNDIATLHEDELAKEDIDWDPSVPFTSHTDKGEDIPIKSRRSMRKMMTNRTMYILGCLLFKPRRVSLITNHLFSFAMALSFLGQCSLVEAIAHRCSVITSLLLVSPGIPFPPSCCIL